jgi:hypothetical protein
MGSALIRVIVALEENLVLIWMMRLTAAPGTVPLVQPFATVRNVSLGGNCIALKR